MVIRLAIRSRWHDLAILEREIKRSWEYNQKVMFPVTDVDNIAQRHVDIQILRHYEEDCV
jgi:hypothetical protein